MTEQKIDLSSLCGLYVAMLDDDELTAFNAACREGRAYRDYSGPAGMFGVAKVGITKDPA